MYVISEHLQGIILNQTNIKSVAFHRLPWGSARSWKPSRGGRHGGSSLAYRQCIENKLRLGESTIPWWMDRMYCSFRLGKGFMIHRVFFLSYDIFPIFFLSTKKRVSHQEWGCSHRDLKPQLHPPRLGSVNHPTRSHMGFEWFPPGIYQNTPHFMAVLFMGKMMNIFSPIRWKSGPTPRVTEGALLCVAGIPGYHAVPFVRRLRRIYGHRSLRRGNLTGSLHKWTGARSNDS